MDVSSLLLELDVQSTTGTFVVVDTMSRRSTSAMGPPPDRDVVMGPPPSSASTSASAAPNPQKLKETQDVTEKYKRLKRKYFELEEVSRLTSKRQRFP